MKHAFPFRLGCTSYVYPDDILPNAEKCAPLFDDIELVLFESLDASNMPSEEVIRQLAELGKKHGTTYTVHFPIDKKACSPDPAERKAFLNQLERVIRLSSPLAPYAFLLHLEGDLKDGSRETMACWLPLAGEACGRVRKLTGAGPARICVENLGYPCEWHLPLLREHGLSACADMGHLWRYDDDWEKGCDQLMPYARVIHLHGWDGRKDHVSLARMDQALLAGFVRKYLKQYKGVLTLEVFSEQETFESVEALKSLWEK